MILKVLMQYLEEFSFCPAHILFCSESVNLPALYHLFQKTSTSNNCLIASNGSVQIPNSGILKIFLCKYYLFVILNLFLLHGPAVWLPAHLVHSA